MADLSAVKDDHLNIRQTVEMMNIPDVNVFEIRDATWKQMEDLDVEINQLVMLRSKELKNETGICGLKFKQGIPWDRAKIRAMMEGASDDYIIVSIESFDLIIGRLTSLTRSKNSLNKWSLWKKIRK